MLNMNGQRQRKEKRRMKIVRKMINMKGANDGDIDEWNNTTYYADLK